MKKHLGSKIVIWVSVFLVAAFNLFAAVMKFVPQAPGSEGAMFMEKLGISLAMEHTLGVIELAIILLFVIPRTSTVGFVLMVGYMGGALATNLTHGFGTMDVMPIYVSFVLLMIIGWLRNPELVARLLKRPYPHA